MMGFKMDTTQPYSIIEAGENSVKVWGTSKVCHTSEGFEFGGYTDLFTIDNWDLLTKAQKKAIKWTRRKLGDRRADRERNKLCAGAIATHLSKNGATWR